MVIKMIEYDMIEYDRNDRMIERKGELNHIEIFILTLVICMLLTLPVFLGIMHRGDDTAVRSIFRDHFRKVIS